MIVFEIKIQKKEVTMGDNNTRYREIRNALDKIYPVQPQGNAARHLNTLAATVSGIVGSGSTQLPKIADKVPAEAKSASVEKRISRWIDNSNVTWKLFFLPYAEALLLSLGLKEIVLAVDVSDIGRGCRTLIVNVVYKKRALPLAWIVAEGGKGHFSEENHIDLIKQVHEMIPESAQRVVLVGDGEFDGIGLQKTPEGFGWYYVCRTSPNIRIGMNDEVYHVGIIGSFIPEGFHIAAENILFTGKGYGPVTVIAWRGEGYAEPVYLVTNMKSPEDAMDYYSKRFRIETFFSDQKSRGFHLHKSHLSDPERLSRLMIAACLAYIWIVFPGTPAVTQGWIKIIHRSDRCDLSLFQSGLKLLNYFPDHDISVPVAFHMVNQKY
jgi:hypothetical protein